MKKLISSGSAFEQTFAYSRAVVDGDYVFVSGTTGYDYSTMEIDAGLVEQTEQCFKNIAQVLAEAGSSLNQVVRIHYILPDKRDFALCAPVMQKYLSESRPAATMIEAGLLDDAMKIEIEVTARTKI
ncbi:RidA family protein [Marinicella litoralis]|uniref:Reactive intermediate/imine deaminase n=1 Tax=Marinicella litoralis TaxID=644220 RepID=A0A4R6XZB7_9GAMM|nr:RidA family protein [Marinicella litoralis]TDR23684.1 reactive intermediate/imine deaminase [Marinicella litoralis]